MSANTNAEQFADQGRTLPGFKNLSLPGIKEQVAQILALTGGRQNGAPRTKTLHAK